MLDTEKDLLGVASWESFAIINYRWGLRCLWWWTCLTVFMWSSKKNTLSVHQSKNAWESFLFGSWWLSFFFFHVVTKLKWCLVACMLSCVTFFRHAATYFFRLTCVCSSCGNSAANQWRTLKRKMCVKLLLRSVESSTCVLIVANTMVLTRNVTCVYNFFLAFLEKIT